MKVYKLIFFKGILALAEFHKLQLKKYIQFEESKTDMDSDIKKVYHECIIIKKLNNMFKSAYDEIEYLVDHNRDEVKIWIKKK